MQNKFKKEKKNKKSKKQQKPKIECPICCEITPFSQQVKCDTCCFETCKGCLKRYILDEAEPRCINPSCNMLLDKSTIMMKITKKFHKRIIANIKARYGWTSKRPKNVRIDG